MFFDFSKFKSIIFSGMKISQEGIPSIVGFKELGFTTYPVTVALYGLHQYQKYENTKNKDFLNSAITCGRWLLNKGEKINNTLLWKHPYPNRFLKMEPGWICGLTQALGGALFLYLKRHSEKFEGNDTLAIEPLFHPVREGGIANSIGDYHFLEEYPSNPPSATLNGFLYMLLVLHEFAENGHKKSKDAFTCYTENLKKHLHLYDTGYWSLYDLWIVKRLASREYHFLHIGLLERLYEITGDPIFHQYKYKWERYWRSSKCRLMWFTGKIKEKTYLYLVKR